MRGRQYKRGWFENGIIVHSSAPLSVDSKATPHASAIVQTLNFGCFRQKSNVERLQSLHLPPSPRVSPTGQLEVDCQLICRTIDNHLLPLLLHTSAHKHVNKSTNTHTRTAFDSPTKLTGMKCSAADLSPCFVSVCVHICQRRRFCIKTHLIGPV